MARKFKFGYKFENMKIVIVDEEASLIRQMHQDYLAGMSTSHIAKKLNTQPIRYNEKISEWERGNVSCIFKDKTYLGNEDYPQIIEKEINDAVLALAEKNVHRIPKEEQAHAEVFKDKMRCSICGGVIIRKSTKKGRKDLVLMQCQEKKCECNGTYIHLINLEKYIKTLFDSIANNPDIINMEIQENREGYSEKIEQKTTLLKISMRNPTIAKTDVVNQMLELASMKFNESRTSNDTNVTEKLKEEIHKASQDRRIGADAIDKTIRKIYLTPEKIVRIRFKNGREFEERVE